MRFRWMEMRLLFGVIGLLVSVCGLEISHASPSPPIAGSRRILILIGYTDGHDKEALADYFRYSHSANLARNLQLLIGQGLEAFGFFQRESLARKSHSSGTQDRSLETLDFSKGAVEVTVLNSNATCANEKDKRDAVVYSPCPEQLRKTQAIASFLDHELRNFDEFFYIGHARLGLGLAIGPFQSESTYPLFFYNDIELGRLKKVVMGSCESNRLYRNRIGQSDKIEFHGVDQAQRLQSELLGFLLNHLAQSVAAD